MTMHIKAGGAWKEVTKPSVKTSGVWKGVTDAWVKVSGSWKKFYAGVLVTVPNLAGITSDTYNPPFVTEATASFTVLRNGGCVDDVSSPDWISPKHSTVGDGYEVRLDYVSGASPSGPALGSWHALTSNRSWSVTQSGGVGTVSFDGTLRIRNASTLVEASPNSASLSATLS